MEYLVTSSEMKEIDRFSIQEVGIPSLVLMERAAMAVADRVMENCGACVPVLVVCGTGNNGADGLAVARLLSEAGYPVKAVYCGSPEKATEEWKVQKNILDRLHIPVSGWRKEDVFGAAVIVDAIFGIGLSREVQGEYRDLIEAINQARAFVYSIDVPSGIHASCGKVLGVAVKAAETVTFGCCKAGMILYPGAAYAGKITVADVGFPKEVIRNLDPACFFVGKEDIRNLPERPEYSNKGTFGKILILAGSRNMAGAAYFAAKAAFSMGCGLVRILTVEENREILQTLIPEAVLSTYHASKMEESLIRDALDWSDVLVMGPGLSTEAYAEQLAETVFSYYEKPAILDADALNLLAKHPEWKEKLRKDWILTPHMGELARLLGCSIRELTEDMTKTAILAREQFPCTVVCKDAVTLTVCPGEKVCINRTGNSGMAVGGSGDVLTGVIAGLLPVVKDSFRAACLGVWLHGAAGDKARKEKGARSMGAVDIAEALNDWEKDHDGL